MTDKKTILVTGGAGFIGSHLCKRLALNGHQVISLDNYFTGSRDNHVKGVEYRDGHTKEIEKHITEKPDLIYHLGEYSRVEQSIFEPEIVEDFNVVGTKAVLEFWQKHGGKLVYAGSSTKFGDGGLAREKTPYASTKAKNSELVKECGEKYSLPYAITYFYNVYGPGERFGAYGTVIEIFKKMYLQGSPITVTSPGTQERNFTHVEDIVDGLVLVGERGDGDEFGLGNDQSFTMLEVAKLFGSPIVMLPPRGANRMQSDLDTRKSRELGWKPRHSLEDYITKFTHKFQRGKIREKRVLLFSTTFYPVSGIAADAFVELAKKMPEIEFDVVTTKFTSVSKDIGCISNIHIHTVGIGYSFDKYLLPFLGYFQAKKLHKKYSYLFIWSLLASYAALAGLLTKKRTGLPLLITLADQNIENLSRFKLFMLNLILSDTDRVYGSPSQKHHINNNIPSLLYNHSLGNGDALANQLGYSYNEIIFNH